MTTIAEMALIAELDTTTLLNTRQDLGMKKDFICPNCEEWVSQEDFRCKDCHDNMIYVGPV